jgi:CheY-like chemotaxis protein
MSKILIADDSHDGADSLALLLGIYGHETTVAYDGGDALACASAFLPDAVVLDIDMPIMDGYEAARVLRSWPPARRPLLVALTAVGGSIAEQLAAEAGFDLHVVKPANVKKLSLSIDAMLVARHPVPLAVLP